MKTERVIIGLLIAVFLAFISVPTDESIKIYFQADIEAEIGGNSDIERLIGSAVSALATRTIKIENHTLYKEIKDYTGNTIGWAFFGQILKK